MHCVDCVPNAHHDMTTGECVCDACYEGPGCTTLKTECCHCACGVADCFAPGTAGCNTCAANAYRNNYGECQCHEDYVGECCDNYRGECACHCESCFGPNENQCMSCSGHGVFDSITNSCTCAVGYTGCQCDQYAGVCHKLCIGCFGPTEFDCIECAPNSAMSA